MIWIAVFTSFSSFSQKLVVLQVEASILGVGLVPAYSIIEEDSETRL